MIILKLLIALCLLFLTGCGIPASRGIHEGNIAFEAGNYKEAQAHFARGLAVAQSQGYQPHIATSKYGLGRSYGQLGNYRMAEKNLREAATLENQISKGKGLSLSQDYFELARLYHAYHKYPQAVVYYKKAVPIAESLGVERSDPIGYANILEKYASALSKSGIASEAGIIRTKIAKLRNANPGRPALFYPRPYNKR